MWLSVLHDNMERAKAVRHCARALDKPPGLRSPADIQYLAEETAKSTLFTARGKVVHRDLCYVATRLHLPTGEVHAITGQDPVQSLYVQVLSGRVEILTNDRSGFEDCAPPPPQPAQDPKAHTAAVTTTATATAASQQTLPSDAKEPCGSQEAAEGMGSTGRTEQGCEGQEGQKEERPAQAQTACGASVGDAGTGSSAGQRRSGAGVTTAQTAAPSSKSNLSQAGAGPVQRESNTSIATSTATESDGTLGSQAPMMSEQELHKLFDTVDVDHSGAIDTEELQQALQLLGIEHTLEEVQELVDAVDVDGSRQLEFAEFQQILSMTATAKAKTRTGWYERHEQILALGQVTGTWCRDLSMGDSCGGAAVVSAGSIAQEGAIRALEDTELLVITRRQYEEILRHGFDGVVRARVEIMRAASCIKDTLKRTPLRALAAIATLQTHSRGAVLCRAHCVPTELVLILTGTCMVTAHVGDKPSPDTHTRTSTTHIPSHHTHTTGPRTSHPSSHTHSHHDPNHHTHMHASHSSGVLVRGSMSHVVDSRSRENSSNGIQDGAHAGIGSRGHAHPQQGGLGTGRQSHGSIGMAGGVHGGGARGGGVGRTVEVAVLCPGDVCGEAGVLGWPCHTYNVVVSTSQVLALHFDLACLEYVPEEDLEALRAQFLEREQRRSERVEHTASYAATSLLPPLTPRRTANLHSHHTNHLAPSTTTHNHHHHHHQQDHNEHNHQQTTHPHHHHEQLRLRLSLPAIQTAYQDPDGDRSDSPSLQLSGEEGMGVDGAHVSHTCHSPFLRQSHTVMSEDEGGGGGLLRPQHGAVHQSAGGPKARRSARSKHVNFGQQETGETASEERSSMSVRPSLKSRRSSKVETDERFQKAVDKMLQVPPPDQQEECDSATDHTNHPSDAQPPETDVTNGYDGVEGDDNNAMQDHAWLFLSSSTAARSSLHGTLRKGHIMGALKRVLTHVKFAKQLVTGPYSTHPDGTLHRGFLMAHGGPEGNMPALGTGTETAKVDAKEDIRARQSKQLLMAQAAGKDALSLGSHASGATVRPSQDHASTTTTTSPPEPASHSPRAAPSGGLAVRGTGPVWWTAYRHGPGPANTELGDHMPSQHRSRGEHSALNDDQTRRQSYMGGLATKQKVITDDVLMQLYELVPAAMHVSMRGPMGSMEQSAAGRGTALVRKVAGLVQPPPCSDPTMVQEQLRLLTTALTVDTNTRTKKSSWSSTRVTMTSAEDRPAMHQAMQEASGGTKPAQMVPRLDLILPKTPPSGHMGSPFSAMSDMGSPFGGMSDIAQAGCMASPKTCMASPMSSPRRLGLGAFLTPRDAAHAHDAEAMRQASRKAAMRFKSVSPYEPLSPRVFASPLASPRLKKHGDSASGVGHPWKERGPE